MTGASSTSTSRQLRPRKSGRTSPSPLRSQPRVPFVGSHERPTFKRSRVMGLCACPRISSSIWLQSLRGKQPRSLQATFQSPCSTASACYREFFTMSGQRHENSENFYGWSHKLVQLPEQTYDRPVLQQRDGVANLPDFVRNCFYPS